MKTSLVSRFHPLLVMLHWPIAVLIVALLCVGFLLAVAVSNADPLKPGILMWHMAGGMLVAAGLFRRMWFGQRVPDSPAP